MDISKHYEQLTMLLVDDGDELQDVADNEREIELEASSLTSRKCSSSSSLSSSTLISRYYRTL
jgi:hypothetical protein